MKVLVTGGAGFLGRGVSSGSRVFSELEEPATATTAASADLACGQQYSAPESRSLCYQGDCSSLHHLDGGRLHLVLPPQARISSRPLYGARRSNCGDAADIFQRETGFLGRVFANGLPHIHWSGIALSAVSAVRDALHSRHNALTVPYGSARSSPSTTVACHSWGRWQERGASGRVIPETAFAGPGPQPYRPIARLATIAVPYLASEILYRMGS